MPSWYLLTWVRVELLLELAFVDPPVELALVPPEQAPVDQLGCQVVELLELLLLVEGGWAGQDVVQPPVELLAKRGRIRISWLLYTFA